MTNKIDEFVDLEIKITKKTTTNKKTKKKTIKKKPKKKIPVSETKRIKRTSQGRPRNKVLTSAERSTKRLKKRVTDTTRDKPVVLRKTGKRGRPAFTMPYSEARAIIRSENLSSRNDFLRWWNINIPARIPKNPPRTYEGEWESWGDFLGTYNTYPETKKYYRSFHDARDYARSLMIKTRADWMQLYDDGKIPDDIPKHPRIVYGKTIHTEKPKRGGYWVSWKDWCGTSFMDRLSANTAKIDVVIITQMAHFPNNVYAFMALNGLELDIYKKVRDDKINVIKAYKVNNTFDWGKYLFNRYTAYYNMPGIYLIHNISDVYYNFDMNMDVFRI